MILPRHYSRKSKRPTLVTVSGGASVRVANNPAINVSQTSLAFGGLGEHPIEEGQPKEYQAHPASIRTGAALNPAQGDFDEYGAELGPEARVWKTYVKEADRFDAEKVEEWNKSLDVILIFAALFSAISTAFVLESSKKLQEEPTETSVQILAAISSTLITIANNSQPLFTPGPTPSAEGGFTPTRSAVCVNILWFLSLSLSVAVSLVTMLAKEWCYRFISGRTGHQYLQVRRRQQRWNGLVQWRMPELLVILPSLIHLSLLLFSVGLCIFLLDIHSGVALPVLVVTAIASAVYIASTVLPFLFEHCPYSTTVSRLAQTVYSAFPNRRTPRSDDLMKQDNVTSQALSWLIESCEDPRSVDVALQAIAGADKTLPLGPLKQCGASMKVCHRLTTGSAYPTNYEFVFELYARALAVLQPSGKHAAYEKEQHNHTNELKRQVRKLQMMTEWDVLRLLPTKEFVPTQENLSALRVGSTSASQCLRSLRYKHQSQILEALNSAINLLEEYGPDKDLLHPAAAQSLALSTAMLLACSSIHSAPFVVSPYVIRILNANLDKFLQGLFLTVFAISQADYPRPLNPNPLDAEGRAGRALEVIIHYTPTLNLKPQTQPPSRQITYLVHGLNNLGLLELLLRSREYGLSSGDLEKITSMRSWGVQTPIHTFPKSFNIDQYAMDAIAIKLSNPTERDHILQSQASAEAFLDTLSRIYSRALGIPVPDVYVFVVECTCRISSSKVQFSGVSLLRQFPLAEISDGLVSLIDEREIISLLVKTIDCDNQEVGMIAAGQLRSFIELVLRAPSEFVDTAQALSSTLFECEELWALSRVPELLNDALEKLRRYMMELISRNLSNLDWAQRDKMLITEESARGYLGALDRIYSPSVGTPSPQVYALVVESSCLVSSTDARSRGVRLIGRFPSPVLSQDLVSSLDLRNIIPLLESALHSHHSNLKCMAMEQLCMFIELILHVPYEIASASALLMADLVRCRELWSKSPRGTPLDEPLFRLRQFALETLSNSLSNPEIDMQSTMESTLAEQSLRALRRTYHPSLGAPSPQVYVFVTLMSCHAQDDVRRVAVILMSQFPLPELSDHLVTSIIGQDIVTTLIQTLDSETDTLKSFAMAQLALFLALVLRAPDGRNGTLARLFAPFFYREKKYGVAHQLTRLERRLRRRLTILCNTPVRSMLDYYVKLYAGRMI